MSGCCKNQYWLNGMALVTALVGALLLSACSNGEESKKVSLSGSSTVAPLVQVIGQRFELDHPDIEVDVQTGGSSRGINDALNGLVDIGMASRALTASESEKLTSMAIAQDGIALIVHSDNPVRELSNDEIRSIYTGEIDNWSAVGGPDAGIVVVSKAEGRSTLELFLEFFGLKNSDLKPDVVIGDNQQGIKTIAGNARAIGYVSIGAAEFAVSDGSPISLLPMDGVDATTASVAAGDFPLSRPLNLVFNGNLTESQKQFLDYARSEAVADLVRGQFFVVVDSSVSGVEAE